MWILLELNSQRFGGESENDSVNQRKVLILDPVGLTRFCYAAESLRLLVVTFTAENKVPGIFIRTGLSV